MNIYKAMYYRLFNRTCDIMNTTKDKQTKSLIEQAHRETEEMYMDYVEDETPIINLVTYKKDNQKTRE